MYDPKQDKWRRCSSMLYVRSDAGAVVCNDMIYCIGGFTGEEIHCAVEAIYPIDLCATGDGYHGGWVKMQHMKRRRSGVSCEAFHQYIYAVGGYDGTSQLDSIERYDSFINRWQEVSTMNTPRSNMGLLTINNRIIIVGGYGNDYTTNKCELFDPEKLTCNTIEDLPCPEGCSGIKLVVASSGTFALAHKYLWESEADRIRNNVKHTERALAEKEKARQQEEENSRASTQYVVEDENSYPMQRLHVRLRQ